MLLYIDPGTGSMLFTVLIGIVSILYFFFQKMLIRIKTVIHGGRIEKKTGRYMPYVIYSDNKRYWNIFKPICDIFEEKEIPMVYWTSSPDDPALSEDYRYIERQYIGSINKAVTRLNVMNAGVCLSTTPGLDIYQWKRSKNVDRYVHILHMANDASLYRMFGLDYYDSILLSGQFQADEIRAMEELRNLPEKELVMVGIPYMDVMKQRLEKTGRIKNKGITVLLAPSWGPEGILKKYGDKIIDRLKDTGYDIIIRPHPQSFSSEKEMIDRLMKKYPDSEKLKWNRDNDNFEVLRKADIMITDFSGVIFDYTLVYDKPVIYTAAKLDVSVYDAWWIKNKLWTIQILPKLGRELNDENLPLLKDIIDESIINDRYEKGREEARNDCWANPGKGADKAAEYLINLGNKKEKE